MLGPALVLTLAATSAAGCAAAPARDDRPKPAALAAGSHQGARYDVEVRASGVLEVTASFPAGTEGRFFVEPGVETFVEGLEPAHPGRRPARGEPFVVACATGCTLRYRFDLAGAASALDHAGYAAHVDDAWLAPPSTWLLHPREGDLSRAFVLRVTTPEGLRFATGLPPAAEPGTVGATLADLPSAPYSVIGAMRSHVMEAAGGSVELAIVGGALDRGDGPLLDWVREASLDVAEILDAPVVPHALVLLEVREGHDLSLLTALGNGGASVHAPIGRSVDTARLVSDWRMTHEFVHLGSPGLDRRHGWFSEGLATYLEPIARVRRGRHAPARFWREMVDSLPLGQPQAGDLGLDATHTWGRTYWGGALFCFVADLEARRRSGGERSLLDAVRAIHRAGGDVRARWSMLRMLEVGDRAIGAPVLGELYAQHRSRAVPIDLDALWSHLGVVRGPGGELTFDDQAPLAHVRRAITSR